MGSQPPTFLHRTFRALTNLYPRAFQETFGQEIREVSDQRIREARAKGSVSMIVFSFREGWGLLRSVAYEHWWAIKRDWEREMSSKPLPSNAPGGAVLIAPSGHSEEPSLWWIIGWILATIAAYPLAMILMAPISASILGLLQGLARQSLPGELLEIVPKVIGSLASLAIALGLAHWLLIRPYLAKARRWILVTLLGWTLGGSIYLIGVQLIDPAGGFSGPLVTVGLVLMGSVVGISQWLYLRRVLPLARWWPLINLVAFGSILLVGKSITNFVELTAFMLLPALITGWGMRVLITRSPKGEAGPISEVEGVRSGVPGWLKWSLVGITPFIAFFFATWVYAKAHLALAKNEGIYETPERAVILRNTTRDWGGAEVLEISNVRAPINQFDGSQPHVRFGLAEVRLDRVPDFGRRDHYNVGSYYIQVEEGWVHMPEGAFPEYIGWVMELYGMEGVGR